MDDISTEVAQDDSINSVDSNEILIPQHRFDEIVEKTKAVEIELSELKANQETEQAERLAQEAKHSKMRSELPDLQQESEELTQESKRLTERVAELEGVLNSVATTLLERVPDELRELAQVGGAIETIEWIYKAESMGVITKPVDTSKVPVGKRTNDGKSFIREITNNLVGTLGNISQGYKSKDNY